MNHSTAGSRAALQQQGGAAARQGGANPGRAVVSYSGIQQNTLLAALAQRILNTLVAHLELLTLERGASLLVYGAPVQTIYFPTTAIISLHYATAAGPNTELAVVGQEGAVGISLYEGERAGYGAMVQCGGYAYGLDGQRLRETLGHDTELALLLMRYNKALSGQMLHNAINARQSTVEQRVCHWLLNRLDRSPSHELKVTHEQIGAMLGVRRESVSAVASKLQGEGVIQYSRGTIAVQQRAGLERHAGGLYHIAQSELRELMRDFARGA